MTTSLECSEFGLESFPEVDESEYIDEPPIVSVMDLTISDSMQSPLHDLETIALNGSVPLSNRFQAFTRMYQSPYLDKNTRCIRILLHVLADESISKEDRFQWLTQLKFSSDSLEVCLYGYVYWFYTYNEPLLYTLLSAQFILTHPLINYPLINSHVKYSQQWLYRLAKKEGDHAIRSEAADILLRLGTPQYRSAAETIIHELGQQFVSRHERTLYTNTQNVHDITSIEQAIKHITSETLTLPLDSILDWLQGIQHFTALSSFQRMMMDTGLFYGYRMTELICYVVQRIRSSSHRMELEKRLLEEMTEMNGWCSTGHVIRLVNVFQGIDPLIQLSMSIYEEIKASVFARYRTHLKTCSIDLQEEVAMCFCQDDKTLLMDFIETYSSYDEIKKEYSFMDEREFEEAYQKAIRAYCGV
jgi:hypothetical protein